MDLIQQIQSARVTNPTQAQAFPFKLYDSLIYPAAGLAQFSFFQTPVGAGVSSAVGAAGSAKTFADTNMNLAGQLPSGMEFLIKSIEVDFLPGSISTANQFALAQPIASSLTTPAGAVNDVQTVLENGWLELNVLQQNYVRDAPLKTFPPKTWTELDSTTSTTTVAATSFTGGRLRAAGRPWYLDAMEQGIPGISLQSAVNFEVLVKFPAPLALPSTFNGRMRVILDGFVLRSSQ